MPKHMMFRILDILIFAGSYLLALLIMINLFSISQPVNGIIAAIIAAITVVLVKSFIPVKLTRKDKTD